MHSVIGSYHKIIRTVALAMCMSSSAASFVDARALDVPTPTNASTLSIDIASRDARSGNVTLRFTLVRAGMVRLVLMDRDGKEVGVLASGLSSAGINLLEIDTTKIPAGEYQCILQTRDGNAATKLVITK